jgi:hypothetical protein
VFVFVIVEQPNEMGLWMMHARRTLAPFWTVFADIAARSFGVSPSIESGCGSHRSVSFWRVKADVCRPLALECE